MFDFSIVNQPCLNTFGEAVLYKHGATTKTVTAIWTEGESLGPGVKATAVVLLADLPSGAPAKHDEIERGGNAYIVADDPRDAIDGIGGVKLTLRVK